MDKALLFNTVCMVKKKKTGCISASYDGDRKVDDHACLPVEIASRISQIRALIISGHVRKAEKILGVFCKRFAGSWAELPEINEIESHLVEMKSVDHYTHKKPKT